MTPKSTYESIIEQLDDIKNFVLIQRNKTAMEDIESLKTFIKARFEKEGWPVV